MSEQQTALNALLAQLQQAQPAASPWNSAQAGGPAGLIQGVSVPIKVQTPLGDVRAYLSLPAEIGQNPQALLAAIQQLANAGYPLDAWQPRNSSGGDWGNQQQGGGWNNNSGGYRGNGGYGGGYGGGYRRGGGRW